MTGCYQNNEYSTESTLCAAAVQLGFVDGSSGGAVEILRLPADVNFCGATQFGVTTNADPAAHETLQMVRQGCEQFAACWRDLRRLCYSVLLWFIEPRAWQGEPDERCSWLAGCVLVRQWCDNGFVPC